MSKMAESSQSGTYGYIGTNKIKSHKYQNRRLIFYGLILMCILLWPAFAKQPPYVVTVSFHHAGAFETINLRQVECGTEALIELKEHQTGSYHELENMEMDSVVVDDIDNDGCYDDFLLLHNVPHASDSKIDWYKIDPNGLQFQATLLDFGGFENQILAFATEDLDGDIYLDFLIVEKFHDQKPVLKYYEYEPYSGLLYDPNADSNSPMLVFQNIVDINNMGDRELVSVTFGDFNNLDDIEVITVEYEPIDETTHVVHYTYDTNDPNQTSLEFQGELFSAKKWTNNFSSIDIGRFKPNDRPGLVITDSICYDSSVALEQWGLFDGKIELEEFLLIKPAQSERIVSCNLIQDIGDCQTAYSDIHVLYLSSDFDTDCYSTLGDFGDFAINWQESDCQAANNFCDGTDINEDGQVDLGDLAEVAVDWLNCTDPYGTCDYDPFGSEFEFEPEP